MFKRTIFRTSLLFTAMAFSASLAYSQSIARSDEHDLNSATRSFFARPEFRLLAPPPPKNPFLRSPAAASFRLTARPIAGLPTTAGTNSLQSFPFVRSLNTLRGDLNLVGGANITITPNANTLTIGATGLLGSVAHNATLTGDGTSGSPLGVAVPLILSADVMAPDAVISAINTGIGIGVFAQSDSVVGVFGTSNTGAGVIGTSTSGTGVVGDSISSTGVRGESDSFIGVLGQSISNVGVSGGSNSGTGVFGLSISGTGILGITGTTSPAGEFLGDVDIFGDVDISGNLTKGGGSFKIDHPLDPENKYLYHSFVESPDMMNVYNGNITTDLNGEAIVILPQWFKALNKDFRYQLTVIGQFAQAIVAEEIHDNRFTIKTDNPSVKVSWQVTGVRKDRWAEKNRIQVEVNKPEKERGYFLHPKAFDLPEEMSVEWVRNPESMKQIKELRKQIKQQGKE